MSDAPALDEATRPHLPHVVGADIGPVGRISQQALVAIHGHLRAELGAVVRAVEAVAAGELDAGTARAMVNETTLLRNARLSGSFCAQYCRGVEAHHAIEDAHTFPAIEAAARGTEPTLTAVLERLGEEHEVIHAILVRLDDLLVGMVGDGRGSAAVAAEVRRSEAALTSHLDYEEQELLGPIGRLGVGI